MAYRKNGTLYPSKEYYEATLKVKEAGLTQTTGNIKKAMAGELDAPASDSSKPDTEKKKELEKQIAETKAEIERLEKTEPSDSTGSTPDWLANNDTFKQLPADEQEYLIQYYNILNVQDEENQKILAQALEDAKAQADPYFAEKIRMAQDELTRALGKQTGDFASSKKDLELRIDQIKEDLTTGKDRLSIDQQAELARKKRSYEYQLEGLVEDASHRGLTFSSKRAIAESRLSTEQTDIVESTKRGFQRRISDLQQAASRGEVEAQNLLQDYERTYGENVTTLIRGAERQLGTENLPTGLPALPGVSPLGGVVGSFEEDKQTDILQRAGALTNLKNPFL